MNGTDPVTEGEGASAGRDEGLPPQARTPPSIVVALLAFAVAIAAHVNGVAGGSNKTEGYQYLVTMVSSFATGGFATFVGIVCTIIGAWRGPRSGATMIAIMLAIVLSLPAWLLVGLIIGLH